MRKYIIEIKQSGEGCGYMIDCGVKLIMIEADNMDIATERFLTMLDPHFDCDDVDWTHDYGGYFDSQSLESAVIYEWKQLRVVNLEKVYYNLVVQKERAKQLKVEAKEKEEYERLKKKYK